MPPRIRTMLERCLEKDPKRRIRDVGDAMLLLDVLPTTAVAASNRRLWALGMMAAPRARAGAGLIRSLP